MNAVKIPVILIDETHNDTTCHSEQVDMISTLTVPPEHILFVVEGINPCIESLYIDNNKYNILNEYLNPQSTDASALHLMFLAGNAIDHHPISKTLIHNLFKKIPDGELLAEEFFADENHILRRGPPAWEKVKKIYYDAFKLFLESDEVDSKIKPILEQLLERPGYPFLLPGQTPDDKSDEIIVNKFMFLRDKYLVQAIENEVITHPEKFQLIVIIRGALHRININHFITSSNLLFLSDIQKNMRMYQNFINYNNVGGRLLIRKTNRRRGRSRTRQSRRKSQKNRRN